MPDDTTAPAGAPMPTPTGAPDPAGASGAPAGDMAAPAGDMTAPAADGAVNPTPTEPTAGM